MLGKCLLPILWPTFVISKLVRLKQEDSELEATKIHSETLSKEEGLL